MSQILSSIPSLPESRGRKFQVVEVPPSVVNDHPCPRPNNVILDRYDQGAICLVAYREGKFAGSLWFIKNYYKEDEVRCAYVIPSNQAVWDFDVYVEPEYRLSPVFLKLWDTASAQLLKENLNWSLSRISAFNGISISSHKRMGAKNIGWAVFFSIGIVQLTIASIGPFLHISFSDDSFPVFKFKPSKL